MGEKGEFFKVELVSSTSANFLNCKTRFIFSPTRFVRLTHTSSGSLGLTDFEMILPGFRIQRKFGPNFGLYLGVKACQTHE